MKKLIIHFVLGTVILTGQSALAADGEAVYRKSCFACHDTGAAGAPKLGDAALWAPRVAKGVDALLSSVQNGLNAMPPKGTCMTCSDEELRAAVEFIVSQAEGGAAASAPATAPQAAAPAETTPADEAQAGGEAPAAPPAEEPPTTEGDPAAGEQKAAVCIACHGPGGNSVNPLWPKLAGQHEEFLYRQMQAFKSGKRKNEMMAPMMAPLTSQDMRNLAAYFSAQKISPGQGNPKALEAGKKIYRGGNLASGVVACTGCHGPGGYGNPQAGFPRVASQQAAYIAKALRDFRSGERANDLNGIMRGVTAEMTDAEIDAVAEYMASLQ
ncbi:MAG: hypothetical protein Kow006_14240 [Gammaproteobacteria bacterium]